MIPADGRIDSDIDYYDVYLKVGDTYISIQKVDKKYVHGTVCLQLETEAVVNLPVAIPLAQLPWRHLSVIHYFRRWRKNEGIFFRMFLRRALFLHRYRWWKRLSRDRRLKITNNKYEVLRAIEDLNQYSHEGVNIHELLEYLYGKDIYNSTIWLRIHKRTRMLIDALVEEQCLSLSNDYITTYNAKLRPKALTTIAEYETDLERHTDASKTARSMKWATITMMVAVIFQAVFAGLQYFDDSQTLQDITQFLTSF